MRIVRLGFTCSAFSTRITSIATTDPAPLSVAPVPDAHESRWPPTITTSSLSFGSVPVISATVSNPCSCSPPNFVSILSFESYGHVGFQESVSPAVVLDGRHRDRQRIHLLVLVRPGPESRTVVIKNRSTGSAAIFAIAARQNHCEHTLVREKLPQFLLEFHSLHISLQKGLEICRPDRVLLELLQFGVVVAGEQRLVHRLDLAHLAQQDNLSTELALVRIEILFFLDVCPDGPRAHCAPSCRRPGRRLGNEHGLVRRGHSHPRIFLLPRHSELAPVLEVRVAAAHGRQLIARPLVGLF